MTLKQIIIDRKTRKGESTKITKDGAYWQTSVKFDGGGGDGIGCSGAEVGWYLEVRHYRDGHLRAYINRYTWHQNEGSTNTRTRADDLLECRTQEELIANMQKHSISDDYRGNEPVEVGGWGRGKIAKALPELPDSEKSPDEDDTPVRGSGVETTEKTEE